MSDEFRTCSRTGCRWPAAASLSYRYDTREVWVLDLAEEPHPALYDLCPHHADALTVMRGWARIDERNAVPAVVEPAAPERLRLLAPTRVPATAGLPVSAGVPATAGVPASVASGAPRSATTDDGPTPWLRRAATLSPARTPAPDLADERDAHPAGGAGRAAPAGPTTVARRTRAPRITADRYAGLHSELPRLAAEYVEQLPPTAIRPVPVPSRELAPVAHSTPSTVLLPAVPAPSPADALDAADTAEVQHPADARDAADARDTAEAGEAADVRDAADTHAPPLREVEGQLAIPVAELAGGAVVVSISTRRRPVQPDPGTAAADEPAGTGHDLKPDLKT